jgi:hypothetical protein
MKTVILTLILALNLLVLLYGYVSYTKAGPLAGKFEDRKSLVTPTDEEWAKLSDPKHLPFLREHIRRLTGNVNDFSNSTYLGVRAIKTQSVILMLSGVLNTALLGLLCLKLGKRAA